MVDWWSALDDLARDLEGVGVPTDLAGDIVADIGDIREVLAKIEDRYREIAAGRGGAALLDDSASDVDDHLISHVRSLSRTIAKLQEMAQHGHLDIRQ